MWQNFLKALNSGKNNQVMLGNEAIASILVRAARTDNQYTLSEETLIEKLLSEQMQINSDEAKNLRIRGEFIEKEINDNVQLTRIIKKDIPYEDRKKLVQQLWRIILDDDIRTPEENKFMRVLTYLLGVNDVESAQARIRALKQKNYEIDKTDKE